MTLTSLLVFIPPAFVDGRKALSFTSLLARKPSKKDARRYRLPPLLARMQGKHTPPLFPLHCATKPLYVEKGCGCLSTCATLVPQSS